MKIYLRCLIGYEFDFENTVAFHAFNAVSREPIDIRSFLLKYFVNYFTNYQSLDSNYYNPENNSILLSVTSKLFYYDPRNLQNLLHEYFEKSKDLKTEFFDKYNKI